MTKSTAIALVLGIAAAIAAPLRPVVRAARADDTKRLVALTQAYVSGLESKLAFGVFDETYTQSVEATLHDDHRTMTGELFLTHLPADDTWISVHDVATIDGQPIADREDLATLMQRGSLQSITREVADHNARYNIGRISRNFNEPTLALLVLAPRRVDDFSFSIEKGVEGQDPSLTTLRFEEKRDARVTLISNSHGARLRARGTLIVEPATGRIHRTTFELSPPDMSILLTTEYAHDPGSDLWLPKVFQEHYEGKPNGEHEVVTCSAVYTNFRKFEVLGRIK